MNKLFYKYKLQLSIGILWLFHISAIIGIGLGYMDWFIEKTPLNLLVSMVLFFLIYPLNSSKKLIIFFAFGSIGMFAEWLGVNYQLLFGSYSYGNNFGTKLDGVPYLIGVYWALLTFVTAAIVDYTEWSTKPKIIVAAFLMVLLDFLMEFSAPIFDFWEFTGGTPKIENYVTWFVLGVILQTILRLVNIKGSRLFSLHLYLAEVTFFVFAFFYF
ncbi:carotenoid biosynthesis protein [Winogradskyella aquimaris]|uniref:Carotenoid biosynthesis protein n=1 Tax=Winogradskyella aquimaris TaxID=864074 RepID=A0ABU5EQS9_9FLAO|nr:carotenoid biosynthesis protein [Winogradskyella aquimaris]MDY2587129.1 carotenoid biosynthesis protein [Winogradskyella aquimaris]